MENIVKVSKTLAYILRHSGAIDNEGFIPIYTALDLCSIDRDTLLSIVQNDPKIRFEIIGEKIRARYGHSGKKINLGYERSVPPTLLYHGTTETVVAEIEREGLKSRKRHMVHLSDDLGLAFETASRHKSGEPVLLTIRALEMHNAGFEFYQVANGIWNVAHVPPAYINR